MEESDQKNWSISDQFEKITHGSGRYFLQVSAHVSLKVNTDDSFRKEETMII